jgi:hypothetical protein
VHQLFIDLKKAYDSDRREVLSNTLIEFGINRKLVGIIKMCLNETHSSVRIGKNLSDKFTFQNCLKQDALLPLLFKFCLEYAIRRVQEKQEGPGETGGTETEWDTSALAYADDVNILGENIYTIHKNTEALLDASKEVGLEVNSDKTKYMLMSRKKEGQNRGVKIANRSLKVWQYSNIWEQY